jgi:hypothetical protein
MLSNMVSVTVIAERLLPNFKVRSGEPGHSRDIIHNCQPFQETALVRSLQGPGNEVEEIHEQP